MMKKLILTILILSASLPAFAGNVLQQEDEAKEAGKVAQDAAFHNTTALGLIQDDYLHYLKGGGSLYGVLMYKKEQLEKNPASKKSLDLRYINLMLKKYDIIVKGINPHLIKPDRIIVDDTEYKQLSEDVKRVMAGLNLMMFR